MDNKQNDLENHTDVGFKLIQYCFEKCQKANKIVTAKNCLIKINVFIPCTYKLLLACIILLHV